MKVSGLQGARLEYWYFRATGEFDDSIAPSEADVMGPIGVGWSEVGPILERERIALNPAHDERGEHVGWHAEHNTPSGVWLGETAFIAVTRCYIASKFGDEVPE